VPDASVAVTTVTVDVRDGFGGPKPNVPVVFHDANGAVLASTTTGADGKATSDGPSTPAMATALLAGSGAEFANLVTWTALEAGDVLTVRDRTPAVSYGSYLVSFPGAGIPGVAAGPLDYTLYASGCGVGQVSGTGPHELPLSGRCVRPSNSVLAQARASNGATVGYAYKKGNVPPPDGGASSLTTNAFRAADTTTVVTANAPDAGALEVRLLQISEGAPFETSIGGDVQDGIATFKTASGFAEGLQASAAVTNGGATLAVAKRQASPGTITLDVAQALPALATATVNVANPRRPVVSWTATAPLTGADGGLVRVVFAGPREQLSQWTFVVPPSGATGTLTAPALPDALTNDWLPKADAGADDIGTTPEILFFESDLLPSYAALRASQATICTIGIDYALRSRQLTLPVLPQSGAVRGTYFAVGGA